MYMRQSSASHGSKICNLSQFQHSDWGLLVFSVFFGTLGSNSIAAFQNLFRFLVYEVSAWPMTSTHLSLDSWWTEVLPHLWRVPSPALDIKDQMYRRVYKREPAWYLIFYTTKPVYLSQKVVDYIPSWVSFHLLPDLLNQNTHSRETTKTKSIFFKRVLYFTTVCSCSIATGWASYHSLTWGIIIIINILDLSLSVHIKAIFASLLFSSRASPIDSYLWLHMHFVQQLQQHYLQIQAT